MDEFNLSELFALADEIGTKYQEAEEVEELSNLLMALLDEAQDEGLLD